MRLTLLLLFLYCGPFYGQPFKLTGNWSGIITDSLYTTNYPALLQIKGINGHATGVFRIETPNGYCQYEVSGDYKKKKDFKLSSALKPQSETKGFGSLPFDFTFHYDDSSEYVLGTLNSPGNAINRFRIMLEWDETPYILGGESMLSALNSQAMMYRIKLGVPAKTKRIKELKRFQFKAIYFEVDRYEIDSSYVPFLKNLTRILQSNSDLRLKIIGHTDADGSNEYNLELSKNRANAIFQHLKDLGIAPDRMLFEFQGETNPVETNENERGKQRNRRVEFEFISG
ncbi:MAG: OmpA family protein [Bacteroidota bacterium]